MNDLTVFDIAEMIDHSLLRPTLTNDEFDEGILLARKYKMATCCVAPYDVVRAVKGLAGSGVKVSTVIDFPHGSNLTEAKVYEAELAIKNGASSLDMVLAISRLISGEYDYVENDIRQVVECAHPHGINVKVIFENCFLTKEMIVKACELTEKAGADFVKTSTGYGTGGATLADCYLMRQSTSATIAVKAAGGIRTLDDVLCYRAVGTKMIGTRASASILDEAEKRFNEGSLCEFDPEVVISQIQSKEQLI
ncbi:MAG: deoxyribose-phosphate aldolase [Anaerolineaceae bacterium]|jgi:deoxyribose-phosphate aldolase|nr:MAG: deoxyribose-phosphate aldolase [Anaerolineaceae bacterium]